MSDLIPLCPRCGTQIREEQAHIRCPQCGVIEACCEGAPIHTPVSVDTISEFKERKFQISAHCHKCYYIHTYDLDALIAEGYGNTSIVDFKPDCSKCHDPAEKVIHPPR